jgi:hypothetical protein
MKYDGDAEDHRSQMGHCLELEPTDAAGRSVYLRRRALHLQASWHFSRQENSPLGSGTHFLAHFVESQLYLPQVLRVGFGVGWHAGTAGKVQHVVIGMANLHAMKVTCPLSL